MTAPITLCGSLSRWAVGLGAAMHQAGYDALAMRWHYVPFETEDLDGALAGMRALGIRGLGISMPFKIAILPLLDHIDEQAALIGAVNTVVNESGRLVGHNTDWVGAQRALEEQGSLRGRRALLLGAGGAAKAVAQGLVRAGATLTITNRTDERATELAEALGVSHRPWGERAELGDVDVLVNASSAGMADVDPTSPLPLDGAPAELVVMDIVYKPVRTALVSAARAAGLRCVDGTRMLLHQAARQFELYTDREAPLEAMNEALQAALEQR